MFFFLHYNYDNWANGIKVNMNYHLQLILICNLMHLWFYALEMNWIVKGVKAKSKIIEAVTWRKINMN